MSSQIDVSYRPAFPRGLIILLGVAAALVVALGMRQFANILGPVFMALVLSIAVHPIHRLAARYHLPAWLGMILSLIAVYLIVFRVMAHNSRPSCSRPVKPSSQSVSARRSSKTL